MSRNILILDSSVLGDNSTTRKLTRNFVETWQAHNPADVIVQRDLARNPVPHLDAVEIGARFAAEEERSEEQKASLALTFELIAELKTADVVVVAAPMYNFSVPTTLKAWIDRVAFAGETFRYTDNGPVGLLDKDKKVYILGAHGSDYSSDAMTPLNFADPYLKTVFGFMGVQSVEFVTAEGVALGEAGVQKARERLKDTIAA
ncbi:FMN-dependent NADH-azoreductase [Kiloniella sp. b19]|uniref:FMN-dependent NADH-azoreductase n=1 Tax=Kiloniella sp. GXU_MW_B19 TaxID=3141326 RepID=UPI0031D8CA8A